MNVFLNISFSSRYADVDDVIKKNLAPPIPAYENWVESQTIQVTYSHQLNSELRKDCNFAGFASNTI